MRAILALAAVLAGGCAAQGPSSLRILDARAQQASVALLAGEILFIRLPGSPRLVPAWREERSPDPGVLLFRDATVSPVRGAEGFRAPQAFEIRQYEAGGPGETEILLRAEEEAARAAEAAGWATSYRLKVTVIGPR